MKQNPNLKTDEKGRQLFVISVLEERGREDGPDHLALVLTLEDVALLRARIEHLKELMEADEALINMAYDDLDGVFYRGNPAERSSAAWVAGAMLHVGRSDGIDYSPWERLQGGRRRMETITYACEAYWLGTLPDGQEVLSAGVALDELAEWEARLKAGA